MFKVKITKDGFTNKYSEYYAFTHVRYIKAVLVKDNDIIDLIGKSGTKTRQLVEKTIESFWVKIKDQELSTLRLGHDRFLGLFKTEKEYQNSNPTDKPGDKSYHARKIQIFKEIYYTAIHGPFNALLLIRNILQSVGGENDYAEIWFEKNNFELFFWENWLKKDGNVTQNELKNINKGLNSIYKEFKNEMFIFNDNAELETKINQIKSHFNDENVNIAIAAYLKSLKDYDADFQNDISKNDKTSDNKSQFRKWLINLDKYKVGTINNYVIAGDIIKKELNIDVYNLNDKNELLNQYNNIRSNNEFMNYIKTSTNYFILRGFKLYIEFKSGVQPDVDTETDDELIDLIPLTGGKNIIFYGIPGSGKSYYVSQLMQSNELYTSELIDRTTFHPEYSNSDFIGQILPIATTDNKVEFKFTPGVFTKTLEKAVKNYNKPVFLVIEELNRGNAPAIFGQIFQLLDRDTDGESEYGISDFTIYRYLLEKSDAAVEQYLEQRDGRIYLPSNLYIYATMNTNDQNVFTLDTAFKRRWETQYIKNDFDKCNFSELYLPIRSGQITWREFVKNINKHLLDDPKGYNNEDKQIGAFFIRKDLLLANEKEYSLDQNQKFGEKVLRYIWDDISKINRKLWFREDIKSFDVLLSEFDKVGLEVFNFDLIERFKLNENN